jgi:hypothetical protein
MNQKDRITEILATYQKHGWRLQRILLSPETRSQAVGQEEGTFEGAPVETAGMDALWFSRISDAKREAWELRLIAETQYALFETFEADESEEAREDVRREMEARLRDYVAGSSEN